MKTIKDEPWILRWVKAPFRLHDFDLENVQCINQGSLDKDVTGNPHALLYFVALCRNCGTPVQVSRGTFLAGDLTWRQRWFCKYDPAAYKLHLEHIHEKASETVAMSSDDYKDLNEWLESVTDKRGKKPHEKP